MKHIDIIYFDVTSGHRSAALAIKKALLLLDKALEVRLVNFIDILQYQPILHGLAHAGIEFFNWGVRHETAYFASQQIGFFQEIQSHIPGSMNQQIATFWHDDTPAIVVSVMPICNLMLERALHTYHPDCPYVIIPVDFEESKRSYWFDTRMNAYYINPTSRLAMQAQAQGIVATHQVRVSGMPIDPLFYERPAINKAEALTKLGLNPDLPTILVGFGGQGSVLVKQSAKQLTKLRQPINAIFLCGRHQAIYQELSEYSTPYPKLVLGFTPEAPAYYYYLADILIGKPGSMTITEALITHTALLAIEAKSLALVQRGNEAWLRDSGVGEVIQIKDIPVAVERMLASRTVNQNLQRECHRGVFEIAEVIANMAIGKGL